jgi:YD repeat-containing protein
VSGANGAVATQTVEQYQTFPWGEALTQSTVGTAGLAKTTSWTYYQSSDGPTNIGLLKQVIEPTGRWERYTYDFAGRLTNKVSQFEDNAISTADSANRATLIGYDVGADRNGSAPACGNGSF